MNPIELALSEIDNFHFQAFDDAVTIDVYYWHWSNSQCQKSSPLWFVWRPANGLEQTITKDSSLSFESKTAQRSAVFDHACSRLIVSPGIVLIRCPNHVQNEYVTSVRISRVHSMPAWSVLFSTKEAMIPAVFRIPAWKRLVVFSRHTTTRPPARMLTGEFIIHAKKATRCVSVPEDDYLLTECRISYQRLMTTNRNTRQIRALTMQ